MGVALITKGKLSRISGAETHRLITEVVTESELWTAPANVLNNAYTVRIFGGGGASSGVASVNLGTEYVYGSSGGGGGYMNNKVITLNEGEQVQITIGSGGKYDKGALKGADGGTTSFGSHLSALGGGGGQMPVSGGYAYAGTGGSGGGGCSLDPKYNITAYGGTGKQFGGGGTYYLSSEIGTAGTGGKWGGSGGIINSNGATLATNGVNTSGKEADDMSGVGTGGGSGGGSGGYGGCGGKGINTTTDGYASGGGGGYGANGGDGSACEKIVSAHGGGGGYTVAGKGGNGFTMLNMMGYGAHGGGGGAYGPGGDNRTVPAYGGGGCYNKSGANGICIVQYYVIEYI